MRGYLARDEAIPGFIRMPVVREEQLPEGGWSLYPGGRPNVNLTVKAYYAMRLAGLAKTDPSLRKAEEMARQLGGIEATNSFTRIYLCLFGQYDWRDVPAIPPEIVLLPSFAYINIYEVSSWSRAILVPLSIIYAFQPVRKPPAGAHLRRWFRGTRSRPRGFVPPNAPLYSWKTLFHTAFHTADWTLSALEQKKWTPLRGKALETAELPARDVARPRSSATVLLAEDDPDLRSVICRILRDAGYAVLEASDGDAAARIAAERSGRIDALVTDVRMPHMNGWELGRILRSRDPALRVLYISGYPEDGTSRHLERGDAFLPKPFSVDGLRARLRSLLDSNSMA